MRAACRRAPRGVAWYALDAARWASRRCSSAHARSQKRWPRSHDGQTRTWRLQRTHDVSLQVSSAVNHQPSPSFSGRRSTNARHRSSVAQHLGALASTARSFYLRAVALSRSLKSYASTDDSSNFAADSGGDGFWGSTALTPILTRFLATADRLGAQTTQQSISGAPDSPKSRKRPQAR